MKQKERTKTRTIRYPEYKEKELEKAAKKHGSKIKRNGKKATNINGYILFKLFGL